MSWTEVAEPAQDSEFAEDVEPSGDLFNEDTEPTQDSEFLPVRGFGLGLFGHFMMGHALPNEGFD